MSKGAILYIGTYEREYPRNRQMVRLLEQSGFDVLEIHRPFWERFRDKSRIPSERLVALSLLFSLVRVYFYLVVQLLIHLRRSDAVAIGYIGQLDMLVLGTVCKLSRTPVLFNPLITLTDTLVEDRALIKPSSLPARFVHAIDRLALRMADLIVVDTDQNADYLIENFEIAPDRIAQIHVGADEDVFDPAIERIEFPAETDGLRILFYGKMIPLHGISTILGAIETLLPDPRFSFEIVGSGQLEDEVREFAERIDSPRFVYRSWLAYRRLPERIAQSDCVLGVFGAGEKAGRVVPNKVFQAMAMGAAIITRQAPAMVGVLTHEESAMLIPSGDSAALANAIRRLTDAELRGRLGANARMAFERVASDDAQSRKLSHSVERIVPGFRQEDRER